MANVFFLTACLVFAISCGLPAHGQESDKQWDEHQLELLNVAKSLSRSTLKDGDGWKTYGEFLHPDFTRWSPGGDVIGQVKSIQMIREWWNDGNRQKSTTEKPISVQISGTTGVIRKEIHETYLDASGNDAGEFEGFVTQVWVKDHKEWKLIAASIQPAKQ